MGCPPSCAASDRLLTSLYCHGYQLRLGRENFGTLESPGASSSLLAPVNLSFFVVLFASERQWQRKALRLHVVMLSVLPDSIVPGG